MHERYVAARAISLIPAGDMKDKFWMDWKRIVHDTMDALLVEIGVMSVAPLLLTPNCCFASDRAGCTFYLEAQTPGRKWHPPSSHAGQPLPVPPPLPPNPPVVWNAVHAPVSPVNTYTLQQKWINADLPGPWKYPRVLPPKTQPTTVSVSKTSAPVCILNDVVNFATVEVSAPDQIYKVVTMMPYVSTYQ